MLFFLAITYYILRNFSIISVISVGGGVVKVIGWPVSGWRMESDSAWSIWRATWLSLYFVALAPPYTLSPRMGWPMCAICTRIWWVRPVLISTAIRVALLNRALTV